MIHKPTGKTETTKITKQHEVIGSVLSPES